MTDPTASHVAIIPVAIEPDSATTASTPRRIDDDCTLTYTVNHEAWYADSFKNDPPTIGVHASADGGGVKWEFQVAEHDFNGGCTRLKMFDDAYAALADIPEFFAALHDERPLSLAAIRAILDRLGARDKTERVSPWRAVSDAASEADREYSLSVIAGDLVSAICKHVRPNGQGGVNGIEQARDEILAANWIKTLIEGGTR